MSNKKGIKNRSGDEVEELLLAAQDDLLLNLNLNSHLAHASSSSSPIDQDLVRRFEALKSSKVGRVPALQPQQKVKTSADTKSISDSTGITKVPLPESQKKEKSKEEEEELERVLGADLSARFAALKGSSSSSKTFTETQECPVRSNGGDDADDDGEEDEVEKLIQWAKDAARLDPSSPTDDENDGDSEEDDDDDEEDEEKDHRRKQQQQKK